MISGKYKTSSTIFSNYTWKDFNKLVKSKSLLIFGVGKVYEETKRDILKNYSVEKLIDNNDNLKGNYIDGIEVVSTDTIKEYDRNNYVILVTSILYYEDIGIQLKELGFSHVFSLYLMETRRLSNRFVALMLKCKKQVIQYGERVRSIYIQNEKKYKEYYQFVLLCYIYRINPINSKKIVFRSFNGKGYMDHGKYITEALIKQKLDYDIVWLVNDINEQVPQGVRKVSNLNKKKAVYEWVTAHVWVTNEIIDVYLRKRKKQYYINTKHWTGVTLKKFYFDTPNFISNDVKKACYNDAKMVDVYITASDFDTKSCRRGLKYTGEILECGSPRMDAFFMQNEWNRKVKEKYGIPKDANLVIYAPTFRGDIEHKCIGYDISMYTLDYELLLKNLENKFGNKWFLLMRLHPAISWKGLQVELPQNAVDVSFHKDIQELLVASDILITDYSSCMFEFAYVNKIVFLYASDLLQYKKEREFLFKLNELPFEMSENNDKLVANIMQFDINSYVEKLNTFFNSLNIREDGNASVRVASRIKEIMSEKG